MEIINTNSLYVPKEILNDNSFINGSNHCFYYTSINQKPVLAVYSRISGTNCKYYIYTTDGYIWRKTCTASSNVSSCSNGWTSSQINITDNFLYRSDITFIFIVYFIIVFIVSFILLKFLKGFRKRFNL